MEVVGGPLYKKEEAATEVTVEVVQDVREGITNVFN